MASGLNWVFEEVEEAIILEDDCLPAPGFFPFCDELLARYRDDARVMHIGGNNYLPKKNKCPWSYYYSKYTLSWGWATWRRAWKSFDLQVTSWPMVKDLGLLRSLCSDSGERRYWSVLFDRQHNGVGNTWDYSWIYSCWVQHGVAILPAVNLVTNIGVGIDSTHDQASSWFMNHPVGELKDIVHPPVMLVDSATDRLTYKLIFRLPLWLRIRLTLLNPWMYTSAIRRIPVIGAWWIKMRNHMKMRFFCF
jgi:hypothetical protein